MARYLKSVFRKSRRVGMCLALKGRGNAALKKYTKLKVSPGQHGLRRRKLGDYCLQLKAKQAIKYTYGVLEKQFRRYYKKAVIKKGATGTVLLQLLESRLDNVVYRMGFATTRAEARQLVTHKAIVVRKIETEDSWLVVNVPSFNVEVGYSVGIRKKCQTQQRIVSSLLTTKKLGFVKWVSVNNDLMYGVFKSIPSRNDLEFEFNEQLVVELYSK